MVLSRTFKRDVQVARYATESKEAWMAFQRLRPRNDSDMVTTPMSWPGCGRLPAGVSTLQIDYKHRFIATAQPRLRAQPLPRRLQPIRSKHKSNSKGSKHINDQDPMDSRSQHWAKRWATVRSEQTNVLYKGVPERDLETNEQQQHDSGTKRAHACAVYKPRRKRENVICLSEKEAAYMKQLRGVYANTKEKYLRAERLKESIKALQDKTLHIEIDTSIKEYKKKSETDKGNRNELKRVRDRYHKDKQLRNRKSHISLGALESPQVSRHAYGLPEEGKEFEETKLGQKTEKELQTIWQKAMRRAVVIDRIINIKPRTEHEVSLPKIRVKRNARKDRAGSTETEGNKSDDTYADVQLAMGELEALSSVGSDTDDNLTDIGEEDYL